MENSMKSMLCDLGISDENSIVPFYPQVRDRKDVSVLRCQKSGVILLSRSDHMDISHYENKEDFQYWAAKDRKSAVLTGLEDAQRRFEQFRNIICNKKWLDIGTGAGGILDLLSPIASETVAIEPQENTKRCLEELGYTVYSSLEEMPDDNFDVMTLFHVLEHLTDPLGMLETMKSKMAKGAKAVIEVPHARDFLISFLDLEAFKSFTFWSEHLILHTRESLQALLAKAGFSNIVINTFQRYPLANHIHWLAKAKPGGHTKWNFLRTEELDRSYANMLSAIDKTDTLIAVVQND